LLKSSFSCSSNSLCSPPGILLLLVQKKYQEKDTRRCRPCGLPCAARQWRDAKRGISSMRIPVSGRRYPNEPSFLGLSLNTSAIMNRFPPSNVPIISHHFLKYWASVTFFLQIRHNAIQIIKKTVLSGFIIATIEILL
jgi:hypothetical protein